MVYSTWRWTRLKSFEICICKRSVPKLPLISANILFLNWKVRFLWFLRHIYGLHWGATNLAISPCKCLMAKKSHGTQSLLQFTNCFSGWHCSQFFTVLGRYLHRFCSTILLKIKIYKSYDRLSFLMQYTSDQFRPELKVHVTNCRFTTSLLPRLVIVSTSQPAQN